MRIRWSGGKYSWWSGPTSKARYHSSKFRTIPLTLKSCFLVRRYRHWSKAPKISKVNFSMFSSYSMCINSHQTKVTAFTWLYAALCSMARWFNGSINERISEILVNGYSMMPHDISLGFVVKKLIYQFAQKYCCSNRAQWLFQLL